MCLCCCEGQNRSAGESEACCQVTCCTLDSSRKYGDGGECIPGLLFFGFIFGVVGGAVSAVVFPMICLARMPIIVAYFYKSSTGKYWKDPVCMIFIGPLCLVAWAVWTALNAVGGLFMGWSTFGLAMGHQENPFEAMRVLYETRWKFGTAMLN